MEFFITSSDHPEEVFCFKAETWCHPEFISPKESFGQDLKDVKQI